MNYTIASARLRIVLVILCANIGCDSNKTERDEKTGELGAGEATSTVDASPGEGDAGRCHEVTLERKVCAEACDPVEKSITERTCAEGCPTAEFCYAEVASGDLYTLSCGWELENIEGRLRPCTEEEREQWSR